MFFEVIYKFALLQTDSGGPLVCSDARDIWSVVGIQSWALTPSDDDACGSLDVFTEVAEYRSWIETTIGGAEGSK